MTEPSPALVARILEIVRRVGRCNLSVRIDPAMRLVEDLGIDSLDLVSIYVEIQDQFGVEFEDTEIARMTRIGEIAACVARRCGTPGRDRSSTAA